MLISSSTRSEFFFFFFNDTATTAIYTLSLHDALPILYAAEAAGVWSFSNMGGPTEGLRLNATPRPQRLGSQDRKSTRLNSSHSQISYAVFCLKKKKKKTHRELANTTDGTNNSQRRNIP